MQIVLMHVDAPKSLTADFYEVNLRMDPPSTTAWASFTAAHLYSHVAFIRDDLVLEAPIIEMHVTSGEVALTTQTVQAADQLPVCRPSRMTDRLGIGMLSVFTLSPLQLVDIAADLGCRYISTVVQGQPLVPLGFAPYSLKDDVGLRKIYWPRWLTAA